MKINVLEKQSFLDIVLQETGNITDMFSLAKENNLSITDSLRAGQILKFSGEAADKQIRDYYRSHKINPATELLKIAGKQKIFSFQFSKEFS